MADEEKLDQQDLQDLKTDEQNSAIQIKQYATMWNNDTLMKRSFAAAKYLASSALVPDTYRGKPENCLIAIDIANRTGYSPLTITQQLYVVQGKPAWSGQMAIALVNSCGRFSEPLKFQFVGERGTDDWGCYATTKRNNGEVVNSDVITIQMAKDEGWLNKSGSKWKTMPQQMLMYRAGAFFARVHCPDVLLGLPQVEEVKDTFGYDEEAKSKIVINLGDGEID